MDNFNLTLLDEEGNPIEADENGVVNLLPYIHQKIQCVVTFTPVHALRMIEIEVPLKAFKIFKTFNKKKAYNTKVHTSNKVTSYWFKDEFDRVGRGKKYMGKKHA